MSYERSRDECFGLPLGSSIIGILIGIAIIIAGARELFGWNIDFGPYATIIIGILLIAGAIYTMSRRKSERMDVLR
jgi:type IV secretory pathway VirB2 component (pilin)